MKSNKKKLFLAILIVLFVSVTFINLTRDSTKTNNIMEHMKNGLDSSVITKVYQDDINDVNSISNTSIAIKYADIDLNNDGQNDKIAIIRSAIHSGSHGDTFEILFNDNGSFNKIYTGIIRLFSQEWEAIASIYISNTTTDSFKDIKIMTDGGQLILKYKDGAYQ